MIGSPLGRSRAGAVFLVFCNGTTSGLLDTATVQPGIPRIAGTYSDEHTGSELWMADVTGDGLGDLLICRQDHSPTGRLGSGALTILVGSAALRSSAATEQWLDLALLPASVTATTIVGASAGSTSPGTICSRAAPGRARSRLRSTPIPRGAPRSAVPWSAADPRSAAPRTTGSARRSSAVSTTTGNLIVVGGALLDRGVVIFSESFETGDTSRWSAARSEG